MDRIKPLNAPTADDTGIAAMTRIYAGKMMPGPQIGYFSDPDRVFATRIVRAGAPVRALSHAAKPLGDFPIHSRGVTCDLTDYISRNRVAGLLIMKSDEVVLEHYDLGIDATTRWLSMSVAKSVSTTLIGAAIHDGLIGSVDDPLVRYLPELTGSAYQEVTIKTLMQMTSGVRWDDTQVNPVSERRHMLQLQLDQKPGDIMRYMAGLSRSVAPGTAFNYSTGDTHIVGALLRAATGKWLADYLSEKIWSKLGMESDAAWWLESKSGLEVAGSGMFATLRDYARFGRFIMDDGVIDGTRVLPEGWVREAGSSRMIDGSRVNYGYMWWIVPATDGSLDDGAFSARGIFGQYIYINPKRKILIVVLSSRAKPTGNDVVIDNDFFNATVDALG